MVRMALETFYNSNFHLAAPSAGFLQFPSSDNSPIEHEQYQACVVLNAASANSMHTTSRILNLNADSIPLYTNPTIGSNARENSFARFAFSEGQNMNGSVTTNMISSFNFVQQPALFSSQQTSLLTPKRPQVAGKKQQQTCFSTKDQNSLPSSVNQDLDNVNQRHKKPRLDINEETIPSPFISEPRQQSQENVQLKRNTYRHQLPGLIQHHMLQSVNKLEASQSVPQCHGVFIQPQCQLISDQLQQQVVHRKCDENLPNEGVFTCRLMQYIYHLRNRPADNNIAYWRKFVEEYFSPGAKKRWCVSLYDKVGIQATSIIPKSAMEWQCDMCGCKAGKGFEVTFDSLPRLTKLMFESGVIDELLFLDLPEVCRFPSGQLMLKYGKVVQESVYENFRVVHEGRLHIVFTENLKILSWEFCASCHDVLVPRSLVMSEMVHAAQDYQNAIENSICNGIIPQDSQQTLDQIQTVGCWISNAMEFPAVDDLGFSKSYTRCLQIAEIVQSMKGLMTFTQDNQMGPIESFKHWYQDIATATLPQWEMQEEFSANEFIAAFPLVSTMGNDWSTMVDECFVTASEHTAPVLPGFHDKLVRGDHILGHYFEQIEAGTNLSSKLFEAFQGPNTSSLRSAVTFAANGMSSPSGCDEGMKPSMIQKIMQEMIDSRTMNEFERQTTNLPARVYNGSEAVAMHGNMFRRFNIDVVEAAASDTTFMENRI